MGFYFETLGELNRGLCMLQDAGIATDKSIPRECSDYYNCWGMSSYLLDWGEVQWRGRAAMTCDLLVKTVVVAEDSIQVGDIVVWTDMGICLDGGGLLEHTALITEVGPSLHESMILHKPAWRPPEHCTIEESAKRNWFCDLIMISEIRRQVA